MRFMSLGLAALAAALVAGSDAQAFGKRNKGGCGGASVQASPCGGGFHSAPVQFASAGGCSSCGQTAFLSSGYSGGYAIDSNQFHSGIAWSGQPQIIGQSFQSQPQIIQSGIQPAQPMVQSGHLMLQNNANIQPGMTFIAEPGPQQGTIILRPAPQGQPRQNSLPPNDNK